jgi:hypothetical protein
MTDNWGIIEPHGMRLGKSQGPNWTCLPAEVRLEILETITNQKHRGWASSASVCKEWQGVIEKKNFHRLKLQVSCLHGFEHMIVRQRELVHHIWFSIELPKYTCQSCDSQTSQELADWRSSATGCFTDAIWRLFRILATWQPANTLTLELNAHCPSDSEHCFKAYIFDSDSEDEYEGLPSLQKAGQGFAEWHDPKHGWINGQHLMAPSALAMVQLFGVVRGWPLRGLPEVVGVTTFIIRRQLRRSLDFHTWDCIVDKLCRLEHLYYEPWRPYDSLMREMKDAGT